VYRNPTKVRLFQRDILIPFYLCTMDIYCVLFFVASTRRIHPQFWITNVFNIATIVEIVTMDLHSVDSTKSIFLLWMGHILWLWRRDPTSTVLDVHSVDSTESIFCFGWVTSRASVNIVFELSHRGKWKSAFRQDIRNVTRSFYLFYFLFIHSSHLLSL
jgi:hypothetical protein